MGAMFLTGMVIGTAFGVIVTRDHLSRKYRFMPKLRAQYHHPINQ